ncbi:MAG TPA: hypothetical protein VKR79_11310 [Gaiellaceae bacterium]|nr:hypothetical protein [Gaiellaceae bacterium]
MAKKETRAEREAFIARVSENNRKLLEVAKKAQADLDRRKQSES